MPLENLTGSNVFITNLVPTNPAGTDVVSEGDDHLRGTKNVLINSFPAINGAVTMTPAQLNSIPTLAPLDSPAFTGIPTAPTAAVGTDTTQIATTAFVKANVAESFEEALTPNGWTKLPNGLIMQWGNVSDTSGDKTFPIPFPTACLTLVGNQHPLANDGNGVTFTIVSASTFKVQVGAAGGNTVYWLAVGY